MARRQPQFEIDENGNCIWQEVVEEVYQQDNFKPGHVVTADEWNSVLGASQEQGNYTADSLQEFFREHLNTIIERRVKHDLDIQLSYYKLIFPTDWEEISPYAEYIHRIPATEHKIERDPVTNAYVIDTELLFYDPSKNTWCEARQCYMDDDGTVVVYTDNVTDVCIAILKPISAITRSSSSKVDITDVVNAPRMTYTGKLTDAVDYQTTLLEPLEELQNFANSLVTDENPRKVSVANNAIQLDGVPGATILSVTQRERGYVKNAERATRASYADAAGDAGNAVNATNAENAQHANSAQNASNAEHLMGVSGLTILSEDPNRRANGWVKLAETSEVALKDLIGRSINDSLTTLFNNSVNVSSAGTAITLTFGDERKNTYYAVLMRVSMTGTDEQTFSIYVPQYRSFVQKPLIFATRETVNNNNTKEFNVSFTDSTYKIVKFHQNSADSSECYCNVLVIGKLNDVTEEATNGPNRI